MISSRETLLLWGPEALLLPRSLRFEISLDIWMAGEVDGSSGGCEDVVIDLILDFWL